MTPLFFLRRRKHAQRTWLAFYATPRILTIVVHVQRIVKQQSRKSNKSCNTIYERRGVESHLIVAKCHSYQNKKVSPHGQLPLVRYWFFVKCRRYLLKIKSLSITQCLTFLCHDSLLSIHWYEVKAFDRRKSRTLQISYELLYYTAPHSDNTAVLLAKLSKNRLKLKEMVRHRLCFRNNEKDALMFTIQFLLCTAQNVFSLVVIA